MGRGPEVGEVSVRRFGGGGRGVAVSLVTQVCSLRISEAMTALQREGLGRWVGESRLFRALTSVLGCARSVLFNHEVMASTVALFGVILFVCIRRRITRTALIPSHPDTPLINALNR